MFRFTGCSVTSVSCGFISSASVSDLTTSRRMKISTARIVNLDPANMRTVPVTWILSRYD